MPPIITDNVITTNDQVATNPFTIINNTLTNATGYEENRLEGITVTVHIDPNQMKDISELALWTIRLLIKKIICSSEIFL